MQKQLAVTTVGAVAGGFLFFFTAVAVILGLGLFNARVSPAVPWFPIPVLLLLYLSVRWIDRRWHIGLALPPGRRWWAVALFAVLVMIAARCLAVIEGSLHGATKTFEAAPAGVSALFALAWWATVLVAMSTASETAFRGIMHSRLAPLFGPWPAILFITFANLVVHRWDGLYERTLGVIAILVAWGWIREISGSLTPAILSHIALIVVWDSILWFWGPWDQSAMGTGTLVAVAAVGVSTLAGALWLMPLARGTIPATAGAQAVPGRP